MQSGGNDVYCHRVLSRFSEFQHQLTDLNFVYFDGGKMRTQVLFATLTYDTKLKSQHHAWMAISKEYNLFMSKMRRVFGSISTYRTWEAFENGYPHIHVVMLFNDFSFQVRDYIDKKDHKVLLLDDDIKNCISAMWHSNVDVKGVGNVSESTNYLGKYVTKCADFDAADSKGLKTLAQCWAYRKRAYCLSGVFRQKMTDLIHHMQNSNSKIQQLTLNNEKLDESKWSCLGFVSRDILEIEPFVWHLTLSDELRERVYEDLNKQEKTTYE